MWTQNQGTGSHFFDLFGAYWVWYPGYHIYPLLCHRFDLPRVIANPDDLSLG